MEQQTQLTSELPDVTLAAFLGALDDIATNTEVDILPSPDNDIAEKVLGLFDMASNFYDADLARNMELLQNLATRLGNIACGGHGHMQNVLNEVTEKFGLTKDEHGHDHGHSHDDHDNDEREDGNCSKKCKRKHKHSHESSSAARASHKKPHVTSYLQLLLGSSRKS